MDTAELNEIRAGFSHHEFIFTRNLFLQYYHHRTRHLDWKGAIRGLLARVYARALFFFASSSGLSVCMCVCDRPRLVFSVDWRFLRMLEIRKLSAEIESAKNGFVFEHAFIARRFETFIFRRVEKEGRVCADHRATNAR